MKLHKLDTLIQYGGTCLGVISVQLCTSLFERELFFFTRIYMLRGPPHSQLQIKKYLIFVIFILL